MNPHTGAAEKTKPASDAYRAGWDAIFGKKIAKQLIDNDIIAEMHRQRAEYNQLRSEMEAAGVMLPSTLAPDEAEPPSPQSSVDSTSPPEC